MLSRCEDGPLPLGEKSLERLRKPCSVQFEFDLDQITRAAPGAPKSIDGSQNNGSNNGVSRNNDTPKNNDASQNPSTDASSKQRTRLDCGALLAAHKPVQDKHLKFSVIYEFRTYSDDEDQVDDRHWVHFYFPPHTLAEHAELCAAIAPTLAPWCRTPEAIVKWTDLFACAVLDYVCEPHHHFATPAIQAAALLWHRNIHYGKVLRTFANYSRVHGTCSLDVPDKLPDAPAADLSPIIVAQSQLQPNPKPVLANPAAKKDISCICC